MKKKICFTVWADRLSGAEKRFLRIAPGIITKPRKFDYFFMINEHMYDIAKESQELSPMLDYMQENNRLIIVPEPPVYYKGNLKVIWFNRQFIKNIRKYKIDAAHVVIKAINWTFLPLFLGMKTKIFYELTSPERVDSFFKSPVKYLLPKLTALHCVSPSVNKRFLKVLKENNKELYSIKVYTAPITYFKFPVINNTGPKENLIIFASRFIERKNPILFAEAVKLFLKQKPDWKVAILGSGPLEDKIRAIVKNEIENGSVSVDYTKDIYSYFQRSKIIVSVIFPDNYPSQSILEAMYMKNALIATDVGDTNKFLKEGRNGIFVDFDKESIVNALNRLTSDNDLLSRMGEESLKIVESDFSPEVYFENMIAFHSNFVK